jgi:hypothetical protein
VSGGVRREFSSTQFFPFITRARLLLALTQKIFLPSRLRNFDLKMSQNSVDFATPLRSNSGVIE